MGEILKTLSFQINQRVVQLPGEDSAHLHERLRPLAIASTQVVEVTTRILTPSWYTFDARRILTDIPNSVVICTSTCKHEIPFRFFVGRREHDWQREVSDNPNRFTYTLQPLGRELFLEEMNAIYDNM